MNKEKNKLIKIYELLLLIEKLFRYELKNAYNNGNITEWLNSLKDKYYNYELLEGEESGFRYARHNRYDRTYKYYISRLSRVLLVKEDENIKNAKEKNGYIVFIDENSYLKPKQNCWFIPIDSDGYKLDNEKFKDIYIEFNLPQINSSEYIYNFMNEAGWLNRDLSEIKEEPHHITKEESIYKNCSENLINIPNYIHKYVHGYISLDECSDNINKIIKNM